MKIINKIFDKRIKALNCLIEIELLEYFKISSEILKQNPFQRRRVKSSSTVYSLLKKDIVEGCVIPPIVLAHTKLEKDFDPLKLSDEDISKMFFNDTKRLIILDGLQRTYTIKDLVEELISSDETNKVLENKIRIELYIGIDKIGILYRMLTLNTGQTPMSIRHQIEILYSDYLKEKIDDIELITESESKKVESIYQYNFKDVVEGFNSYLDRDYLTIDRFDILDNIKSLEKLSKENQDSDLFIDYVKTYHKLSLYFNNKLNTWNFNDSGSYESEEEGNKTKLNGQPFIKNIDKLFSKSQVMTGFGSAIGKLIDLNIIDDLKEINDLINNINIENHDETLIEFLNNLDYIRTVAKKIGNDQRLYFHFIFRELFDKKGDAYLNFNKSVNEAFISYQRKTQ